MRAVLLLVLLATQVVFAEEKKETPAIPAPVKAAMTVKGAKKLCKEAGKEGAELLKCIKEKKGVEQ